MKVINDNEELKSYIVDGVVKFNESIKCCFDIFIDADIKAYSIEAYSIEAYSIEAYDIDAHNIKAHNIKAYDIDAHNIKAYSIEADNIKAYSIEADNIKAYSIEAYDILYYAFCIAYSSFKCSNIVGRRVNSIHKCLDNEIEIKKTEINLQGQKFKLSLQEVNNLKQQLK
jgi:hypothetical protein